MSPKQVRERLYPHNVGQQFNSFAGSSGPREAYVMPSPSRLAGWFFSVLISLAFAIVLPRNAVAGEAVLRSPAASPLAIASALPLTAARSLSAWPSERRFLSAALALTARLHAFDGVGPTLCQITDTVYRADGAPAQGDL